ncbi:hypothetical protein J3R74_000980 [Puniceicoccus vermicola]
MRLWKCGGNSGWGAGWANPRYLLGDSSRGDLLCELFAGDGLAGAAVQFLVDAEGDPGVGGGVVDLLLGQRILFAVGDLCGFGNAEVIQAGVRVGPTRATYCEIAVGETYCASCSPGTAWPVRRFSSS